MNKTILSSFLTIIITTILCTKVLGAEQVIYKIVGNTDGPKIFGPLPQPQFEGLTDSDVYPGVYLAAVYRFKTGATAFGCVAAVYQSGPTNFEIILPKHLFSKDKKLGFEGCYAVRIVRPDGGIFGFIDKLYPSKKGSDIVIGTIQLGTKNPPIVKDVTDLALPGIPYIKISSTVTMSDKEVKNLHSFITGKEIRIIGYGFELQPNELVATNETGTELILKEKPHQCIVIDRHTVSGSSGSPYFDQNGRIFIIHGVSLEIDKKLADAVNTELIERNEGKVKGLTYLDGPIDLLNSE